MHAHHPLQIVVQRGARGFGVELANNYVAAVARDSNAHGKL